MQRFFFRQMDFVFYFLAKNFRSIFSFSFFFLLLMPDIALAQINGFASAMLHLQDQLGPVWKMIVGIVRLAGLWFGMLSVYKLKVYGRMTAFMSQNASLLKPLTYLIVGAALWYLPELLDLSIETIWGYDYSSVKSYEAGIAGASWDNLVTPVTLLIRIVGLISFLRGWVLVVRSTNEGTQPGTLGKGVMHIFGGILAINIIGTVSMLRATLGF